MRSRTPITDAEIAHQDASVQTRIAAGALAPEAIHDRPYSGVVGRDLQGEIADFMIETGSGTMEDLLLRFSPRDLTAENIQAGRDRANRLTVRRAA